MEIKVQESYLVLQLRFKILAYELSCDDHFFPLFHVPKQVDDRQTSVCVGYVRNMSAEGSFGQHRRSCDLNCFAETLLLPEYRDRASNLNMRHHRLIVYHEDLLRFALIRYETLVVNPSVDFLRSGLPVHSAR